MNMFRPLSGLQLVCTTRVRGSAATQIISTLVRESIRHFLHCRFISRPAARFTTGTVDTVVLTSLFTWSGKANRRGLHAGENWDDWIETSKIHSPTLWKVLPIAHAHGVWQLMRTRQTHFFPISFSLRYSGASGPNTGPPG